MTRVSYSGGAGRPAAAAFFRSCDRAVEQLESRVLLSTYLVTNTGDSGPGSLRQAILDADATSASSVIQFDIPGTGVQTIAPASPLPAFTHPVSVQGNTQPGYESGSAPLIEIDGANAGVGATGLTFATGSIGSRLTAVTVNRFAANGLILQADNVQVSSCFIGTNAAGEGAAGNGEDGVVVLGIEDDLGDTGAGLNVISGNSQAGVYVAAGAGANFSGNYIGVDASGAAALGNRQEGVLNAGHVILISQNSIFSNGKLGIDLGNDGVTPNRPPFALTGPNDWQSFPVILSATAYPTYTLVRYQLPAPASKVEFFADDAADPSGYGEGQDFVGSPTAFVVGTLQTVRLPILPVGAIVSATAIDRLNNTSEFAEDVTVIAPPPIATQAAFDPQHNAISFTFSEDVSASLSPSAVRVHNQTTGADAAVTGVSYDSATNTATFQLPGNLPAGTYVVTLLARAVHDARGEQLDGNNDGTPGDDYSFQFTYTAGDVNLDGAVSFADLLILAENFGQTGTFTQGDLNHDGIVNFADLLILAQGYGKGSASPAARASR